MMQAFALEVEELQLQAWGPTAGDMYACAMDLADLDSRIIVKLPITLEGAKAARKLIKQGAPVTMTGGVLGANTTLHAVQLMTGFPAVRLALVASSDWSCLSAVLPYMQACMHPTRWSQLWRWGPPMQHHMWGA
jgi:hypothetical protein